jgi:UDP-glucose 4-epimerase
VRVLVTGGAGFVGSNLVMHLLDAGYDVRALDDLSAGSRPEWWGRRSGPQTIEGRIEDESTARRAARGMQAVVHLAARPGVADSVAHPELDFRVNVQGTFAVVDAARRAGLSRFVFASSGAVLAGRQPPLREEMAAAPLSPYGASKLYGEGIVAASGVYAMVGISLRFANVYGPGSAHKASVVTRFVTGALRGEPLFVFGTGRQTRDFIYVDDVCTAVERALAAPRPGVYHLGTGQETSINALVKMVARACNTKVQIERRPPRPGDAPRSFVDLSSARRDLGWAPRVTLEEGLTRTVASLMKSTSLARPISPNRNRPAPRPQT